MKTIKACNLWAKPLCIAYIALAVICCLPCQSHSQAVTNNDAGAAAPPVKDSTAVTDNRPHRPDSITTFEELDMPVEMQMELNRLTPQGILLFRDEFQGMHDGVYGQTLRMLKIWYIDDHFIGYAIDKPIEVADGKKVIKQRINIPATWMCLPTIVGHPVHTVNSLAELRATETANHCTGWYLKLSLPNDVERHVKLRKARKREIMQAKDSAAALYGYTRKKSHKERKEEKKAIPPPPETEALPADSTGTAKPKE